MTNTNISKHAGDRNVVGFPDSSDERARRLKAEVERLANLPVTEWLFYLETENYTERFGITVAVMRGMIVATISEREKKTRADKAEERHAEKKAIASKKDGERKREKSERDAERKQEKREKEKFRAFKELTRLPSKEQEARLIKLAKRLDEDLETIRAEFEVFADDMRPEAGHVEPWPEPVNTRDLLDELTTQVQRYIVLHDDAAIAISLWVMFAWIHDNAIHSPLLIVTSAERDSGKTTLLGVLERLTPRPYPTVELTGPGLFHVVDHLHPTLIVDEADKLFVRKNDLLHIINAGWTRGQKITRIVHGIPREFDPFCAKVIGMKGLSLPDTLASRGIVVKLWPKMDDEKVADFGFNDDSDFETLRRKLTRWSSDTKVAELNPALPLGFSNRLAANWRILFAIAELAGSLEQAHRAAIALSTKLRQPSDGVRLLAALRQIFSKHKMLPSADVVKKLIADPDAEWCEYRGNAPITQRQMAAVLAQYDVRPNTIHPTGRSDHSPRGYRCEQFADAFARFLPPDPHIRTLQRKTK